MKTKKYLVLAVVIGVFALQLWAGFDIKKLTLEQQSLAGMDAMFVLVEDLQKYSIEAGLTRRQIQTDVELKLRREGIRILSREEMLKTPGATTLCVVVGSQKIQESPILVFDLDVKFIQSTFLERNPKILVSGTTWNRGKIGYAGDLRFVNLVRQGIDDLVDMFLNDYLAANPKEPEKKQGNR